MHLTPRTLFLPSLALIVTASFARADLPAPADDVILTVSGAIAITNGEGTASFDRAMLEAAGATDMVTTTIWTEGEVTFTGVPLAALLSSLGAEGSGINATAINDYAIQIEMDDITETAPMVAYAMNGEAMSVRDKGPLWIVYPYDSDPAYQTEEVYSRSIWQLDRIEVID